MHTSGYDPLRKITSLELRCPTTRRPLRWLGDALGVPGAGHRYPVVDGIPVIFDQELGFLYRSSHGTLQEYYRNVPTRYPRTHHIAGPGAQAFLSLLRRRLERYIKRETAVLEVGAGTGFATDVLLAMSNHVVVTDASLEMLQLNFAKHPDTPMVCCAIERLPFADESFDVVFGNNSFYLVPDKAAGASEVARVLRPGGICLISEMNPFHPLLPVAFTLRGRLFERAIYDETPTRMARRWGEHGMTLEEVDFYSYTPYFAGQRLLSVLAVFEAAFGWSRLVRRFSAIRVFYAIRKS